MRRGLVLRWTGDKRGVEARKVVMAVVLDEQIVPTSKALSTSYYTQRS